MLWEVTEGPWLPCIRLGCGSQALSKDKYGVQIGLGVQTQDKCARWPRELRRKAGEKGLVGFLCPVRRLVLFWWHGETLTHLKLDELSPYPWCYGAWIEGAGGLQHEQE